jgi:hypothetical protein
MVTGTSGSTDPPGARTTRIGTVPSSLAMPSTTAGRDSPARGSPSRAQPADSSAPSTIKPLSAAALAAPRLRTAVRHRSDP